jgi:O-antigen/teichoic acid export membrane protein
LEKIKKFIYRKEVKGFLTYLLTDGITKALPFAIFPIVATYLTVEEFGYVNNYQILLRVFTPFIGLTLSAFYTVEYHRDSYGKDELISNILGLYLLFFAGLFISVLFFKDWLSSALMVHPKWVFAALFAALASTIYTLYLAHLRISEQSRKFGLLNISNSVVLVGLTVLLVIVLRQGAEGRIISLVATSFLTGLWALFKLWQSGINLKLVNFKLSRELLLFGLPLLPHSIALWLKSGYEKAFITENVGLEANGYYSFAFNVGVIVTIAATSFFGAFSPWVYKKLNSDTTNKEETKKKIVRYTYIFLAIITFSIVCYGVIVQGLVKFGLPKYIPANDYIYYVLLYHFFNILYIVFSSYLYLSKSTKYLMYFTLGGALIQIIIMHALVQEMGVFAVLLATTLVSCLTFVAVAIYSTKVYPMPWFRPGFSKK